MARFWFQRNTRIWADLLASELKMGRLRQGWGYSPELDLRIISADRERGAQLSEGQKACWRGNRRLLPTEPDSVKPGDYIITPHLPEEGVWSLVEVTGGYHYEIHPKIRDCGHILEIRLLNPDRPINPRCAAVSAALRRSATNRMRMWNVDYLAENVLKLVKAVEQGDDVSQPEPEAEKVAGIYRGVGAFIENELREKYGGSEFEKPIAMLLERIYGTGNVESLAGRSEHGADFVCSSTDGLGIRHNVAVQVKMWKGTAEWQRPLDQIRCAHENHGAIGAGVVLAMVDNFDDDFKACKEYLEKELKIPIQLMSKADIVNLFMTHLPDLAGEVGAS